MINLNKGDEINIYFKKRKPLYRVLVIDPLTKNGELLIEDKCGWIIPIKSCRDIKVLKKRG